MKLLYSITLPILLLGGILGIADSKKAILSDGSKVDYTLDEKKELNGAYSVSSAEGKVWLRGSYKDNKRVGNWYCFNSDGSVAVRYSYDLKKVIAIDDKTVAKIKVTLNDKDQKVVDNATVPVPICSMDQYLSLFNEQIYSIIGREQKNRPKEIPVDIVAKIDSKGSVSYKLEYALNGYNYSTKLIIKEKLYELDWSPATYEGKIIPAEVTISSKFVSEGGRLQRFIWNY